MSINVLRLGIDQILSMTPTAHILWNILKIIGPVCIICIYNYLKVQNKDLYRMKWCTCYTIVYYSILYSASVCWIICVIHNTPTLVFPHSGFSLFSLSFWLAAHFPLLSVSAGQTGWYHWEENEAELNEFCMQWIQTLTRSHL